MVELGQIAKWIHTADETLFYLAAEELRASRNHFPGEHLERYSQLRAHAKGLLKHRDECYQFLYMQPVSMILSNQDVHINYSFPQA
jgi:hypothetical protein